MTDPRPPSSPPHTAFEQQVSAAIERLQGPRTGSWHTRRVRITELQPTAEGWTGTIHYTEDPDDCSQYDKTVTWTGRVDFGSAAGQPVLVGATLHVSRAGVACGVAAGARLVLTPA